MTVKLQTPEVAALYWAVFAPPLIDAIDEDARPLTIELTPARRTWLESLDAAPAPLLNFINERCRSPRIGLVFESLWHFFLENDNELELLANNLPIRSAGRTLGELDILYRDLRSNRVHHLELAVKFYLFHPPPADAADPASAWFGPELRDRLDLKLAHMRHRQLTMAMAQAAQPTIASVIDDADIDSVQFRFQGALFSNGTTSPGMRVRGIHAGHLHGRQLTATAFQRCMGGYQSFGVLPKPQWLTLMAAQPIPTSSEKVLQRCRRQPQMLIAHRDGERELLMVTADDWGRAATAQN